MQPMPNNCYSHSRARSQASRIDLALFGAACAFVLSPKAHAEVIVSRGKVILKILARRLACTSCLMGGSPDTTDGSNDGRASSSK